MRRVLLAAAAVVALAAVSARADPLDEAKSGLAALDNGDNPTAIHLFTAALNSGRLTRSDQELAHVKRAEAYLASGNVKAAQADADRALDIDPRDAEAVATRDRAHVLLNPPPSPAGGDFASAQARYQAQKQADADQYLRQVAAYDARVKAEQANHEAELVAWRADVQACKAGEVNKCAGGSAQTARPASPSTGALTSPALAPNAIVAILGTATAGRQKFIAADAAWDCSGTTCTASNPPDTATGVDGCKALARTAGDIASYASGSSALGADELRRCNAVIAQAGSDASKKTAKNSPKPTRPHAALPPPERPVIF